LLSILCKSDDESDLHKFAEILLPSIVQNSGKQEDPRRNGRHDIAYGPFCECAPPRDFNFRIRSSIMPSFWLMPDLIMEI